MTATTPTLREAAQQALSDLMEARATLACMAQPQLVALDRAVERIEAIAALAEQDAEQAAQRREFEEWKAARDARNTARATTPQPGESGMDATPYQVGKGGAMTNTIYNIALGIGSFAAAVGSIVAAQSGRWDAGTFCVVSYIAILLTSREGRESP